MSRLETESETLPFTDVFPLDVASHESRGQPGAATDHCDEGFEDLWRRGSSLPTIIRRFSFIMTLWSNFSNTTSSILVMKIAGLTAVLVKRLGVRIHCNIGIAQVYLQRYDDAFEHLTLSPGFFYREVFMVR